MAADPGNEGRIPEEDPRRGRLLLFMNSAHCWLMSRQLRRKRKIKNMKIMQIKQGKLLRVILYQVKYGLSVYNAIRFS